MSWDVRRFEPQLDITTYELSLIVKYVGGQYGFAMCGDILVQSDKSRAPQWDEVKRHFVYVKEAA
jgi:hypothetical protein